MDEQDGYSGDSYTAWGATVGYDRVFGSVIVGGASRMIMGGILWV